MKLSIVVPIYNAERYLKRCLDSLLQQGIPAGELEIICINDGSTDGSGLILEDYAKRYPLLFRMCSQDHSGQANARNLGLDMARGEVVTFCDADDYLIPNGLGYLLDTFWNDQIEVLCHASTTLDAHKLKTWQEDNNVQGQVIQEGTGRTVYEKNPKYFVWNTLIRRSWLKSSGLEFLPLTMTEDSCFMLELMMQATHVVDVSSNIYRYTVNDSQITRSRDLQLMRNCIKSYLYFLSRLKYYQLPQVISFQKIPFYSRLLSARLDYKEYKVVKTEAQALNVYVAPYFIYVMMSFVHRKVFVPYILPHLRRG